MGADLQSDNLKIYEEIYEAAFSVLNQTHKYRGGSAFTIFEQLFSSFQLRTTKYQWMTSIPLMVKKYFGLFLEDVRRKSIEEFYMVLDLVLLKQEDVRNSKPKYQVRFYSKINDTLLQANERSASSRIKNSLLFEDDVVYRCTQMPKSPEQGSVFRQSVLVDNELPKHQTIMKEAIFVENLSPKDQKQISFMVQFYHRFANVLQSMMTNVTFCSLLLRHFQASMKQKRLRKKLKVKQLERSSLIYQDGQAGQTVRQKQRYNQTLLLGEVSDFVELYTAFIWDFYNLDQLESLKIASLISYENINCLILDTVWVRVSWIGERGCQYEQQLLKCYLLKFTDINSVSPVKPEVLQICKTMSLNPMKYLKEIGQGLKNATADDLLKVYKSLFYQLATKDLLKGKLRMIEIVNTIWDGERNGEVGYAWITWQAGLGLLLNQASKYKLEELI